MTRIRPRGFPVERGKIHEFAAAILDEHPHYHDAEAARAAGLPGVVAPPTFPVVAAHFDGTLEGAPAHLAALDMRFVLHGSQEFVFERPLFEGDVLTGERGEVRTYEKGGRRAGRMKFIEIETLYRDAKGEVVLRARATVIQTQGLLEQP